MSCKVVVFRSINNVLHLFVMLIAMSYNIYLILIIGVSQALTSWMAAKYDQRRKLHAQEQNEKVANVFFLVLFCFVWCASFCHFGFGGLSWCV